mmetsp:Transcript_4285/g.9633  ORF Transcript_4285/g.9633 Transcript_4285/m.9633 type:complete len:88 (+) Transcript_4285:59-322(+)
MGGAPGTPTTPFGFETTNLSPQTEHGGKPPVVDCAEALSTRKKKNAIMSHDILLLFIMTANLLRRAIKNDILDHGEDIQSKREMNND